MTVRPPNPDALVRWVGGADQQLRHLQSNPPPSWDNYRWGNFQSFSTDSNGNAVVTFPTAFAYQCFVVILGQVGDNDAWWAFVTWTRPDAFGMWVSTSIRGSFVGNGRVCYLALGY